MKTKYIIVSLALVIFLSTIAIMIWLGTKSNETEDNYKHISYVDWIANMKTHSHSLFKIDESKSMILATTKEDGTFVINASQSIIAQLTQIDNHGSFTSTILNTMPISFGGIFNDIKETSIGIWMALSISSIGSMMPLIYYSKKLINKKTGA